MSIFDKIRLGSALKAVGGALKSLHNSVVSGVKKFNPLVRMYYDSDLGSPIEGEVEKAFAASTCDTLKKFCPDWNWAKKTCDVVGSWMAHKAVQALDYSKVVYQASNGMITSERAYQELAKRTTAGLFAIGKVLCRAGHVVGNLTSTISERILPEGVNKIVKKTVDIAIAESLRFIRKNVFSDKNKERVTKFVEKGMKVAVNTIRKIVESVDRTISKIPEAAKKNKEFISNMADKVGEKVESFTTKVVDAAKNIGSKIKDGAKKLWGRLWGR
jgi:hypothetical protein